jgi:hypothetical protein
MIQKMSIRFGGFEYKCDFLSYDPVCGEIRLEDGIMYVRKAAEREMIVSESLLFDGLLTSHINYHICLCMNPCTDLSNEYVATLLSGGKKTILEDHITLFEMFGDILVEIK